MSVPDVTDPFPYEALSRELAPARSVTKSSRLTDHFLELFRSGKLKPGMRLPPERQLAEMMGVSRSTVREMLKALTMLGLLEARQGSGTVVTQVAPEIAIQPSLFELALQHATFQELTEIRFMLEPELAALAAERATDEDIAAMERACRQYDRYVDQENEYARSQLVRYSRIFHDIIAESAGNRIALEFLAKISSLLQKSREESARAHGSSRSAADHRAILEAIRRKDPEAARKAMQIHLKHVTEDLESVLQEAARKRAPGPPG